jgi:hypothetical protein
MFYKFFRLVSGESILAKTENSCSDLFSTSYITIQDPVLINIVRFPRMGYLVEAHVFSTWISGAKLNTINISTASIITAVDAKEIIVNQYDQYLKEKLETYSDNTSIDQMEEGLDEPDDEEFNAFVNAVMSSGENSEEQEDDNGEPARTLH